MTNEIDGAWLHTGLVCVYVFAFMYIVCVCVCVSVCVYMYIFHVPVHACGLSI